MILTLAMLLTGQLALSSELKFDLKPIFRPGPKEYSIGLSLSIGDAPSKKVMASSPENQQPSKIFYGAAALTAATLLATGCGLKKINGAYTVKGPAENISKVFEGFMTAALIHGCTTYARSNPKNTSSSTFGDAIDGSMAGAKSVIVPMIYGTFGTIGGGIAAGLISRLTNEYYSSIPVIAGLAGHKYGLKVGIKELKIDTSVTNLFGYGLFNIIYLYAVINTIKNVTE